MRKKESALDENLLTAAARSIGSAVGTIVVEAAHVVRRNSTSLAGRGRATQPTEKLHARTRRQEKDKTKTPRAAPRTT
jgi:hypothetical protein